MGKTYRTAQGREIDMEALRLKHELVPAIGNMKVNARGDQLGPGGKIILSREAIIADEYNRSTNTMQPEDGPIPTKKKSAPSDPIPTSSKKVAVQEFTAGDVEADPVPEAKVDLKGGLAKALEKAKKKDV